MAEIINQNTRPGTDATVINYTPDFNGANTQFDIADWLPSGDFQVYAKVYVSEVPDSTRAILGRDNSVAAIFLGSSPGISTANWVLGGLDTGIPMTIGINEINTSANISDISQNTQPVKSIGAQAGDTVADWVGQIQELRLVDLEDDSLSRHYILQIPSSSGAVAGTVTIRDINEQSITANNTATPNNFGPWVAKI